MRIKSIKIGSNEHYGHFVNKEFEFSTDSLTVVYGANESGKSTFLQLVRDLFFGIPQKSGYHFNNTNNKMQMQAMIETNESRKLAIMRRKGNKDTFRGTYQDGKRETIDEQQFKNQLYLPDRSEYENIFAFTQEILTSGEKGIGQTNITQLLYSTAFQLGKFEAFKKRLEEENHCLFIPRGYTQQIPVTIKRIKELIEQTNSQKVDASEYMKIKNELEMLRQRISDIESERHRNKRKNEHLMKLQKSREHYLNYKRYRKQLEELEQSNQLSQWLPEESIIKCQNWHDQLGETQSTIKVLDQQLADLAFQHEQIAARQNNDVLKIEVPLNRLNERKSLYEDQIKRILQIENELIETKEKLKNTQARYSAHADLEQIGKIVITGKDLAVIEKMQTDYAAWRQKKIALQDDLRHEQKELKKKQAEMPEIVGESCDLEKQQLHSNEIKAFLDQFANYSTLQNQSLEKQQVLIRNQRVIENKRSKLFAGLGMTCSHELPSVLRHFPSVELIREYETLLHDSERQIQKQREVIETAREKAEKIEKQLVQLSKKRTLPTSDEMLAVRKNRDEMWRQIHRKYIEQSEDETFFANQEGTEVSQKYETLVSHADEKADQRYLHAKEVAEYENLCSEQNERQAFLDDAQKLLQTLQNAHQEQMQHWLAYWPDCHQELVSRPKIMFELRRQWDEWQTCLHETESVRDELATLEAKMTLFEEWGMQLAVKHRIHMQLDDDHEPSATKKMSFAVMQTIRETVQLMRDKQLGEETLIAKTKTEIHTHQMESQSLQTQIDEANRKIANIESLLQNKLGEMQLPIDWPVHDVMSMCHLIRDIQSQSRQYRRKEEELRQTVQQIEQFEQDVNELLNNFDNCNGTRDNDLWVSMKQKPIEQLDETLLLLKKSENALHEYRINEKAIETKKYEHQLLTAKLTTLKQNIAELFQQFHIRHHDDFQQLAKISREHEICIQQLKQTENQLHITLETSDWIAFETELMTWFGDADERKKNGLSQECDAIMLDENIDELRHTLDELDRKIKELSEKKGGIDSELERFNNAQGAAQSVIHIEFVKQELVDHLNSYMPKMFALNALQHSIERFGREQQPKILQFMQRYFEKMTNGRYDRITTPLVESKQILACEQATGIEKDVDALSTGTREQLYLAMRFAYINEYCENRESLPVILDDVLVNFDSKRQKETFRFLADFAENMQVVFLTCHDATLKIAQEIVPNLHLIVL